MLPTSLRLGGGLIVINNLKQKQGWLCFNCDKSILIDDRVVVQFSGVTKEAMEEADLNLVHARCVRSSKDLRKDRALKLKEEGLKSGEIAAKMGISITSVYSYLRK